MKWCLFCYADFRCVRICKFYFTLNNKKNYIFMAMLVPETHTHTHTHTMGHLQSWLWIRRNETTPNSVVVCLALLFLLWEILVSILAVTQSFVIEDCRDFSLPLQENSELAPEIWPLCLPPMYFTIHFTDVSFDAIGLYLNYWKCV